MSEQAGRITAILPIVSGQGQNGQWQKQVVLIEYGDEWPKKAAFTLWGKAIDQLIGCDVNSRVKMHFNVESRESTKEPGSWFTDARCWRIEKLDVKQQSLGAPQQYGQQGFTNNTNTYQNQQQGGQWPASSYANGNPASMAPNGPNDGSVGSSNSMRSQQAGGSGNMNDDLPF